MNEKLVYKKVNNSDNTITIDLHNGYSVMAISGWQPEKHCYSTSLYLSKNNLFKWELIGEANSLLFHANHKTINSAILKEVSTYLKAGFFDGYINRYEFDMHCLDMIYDLIDKERSVA